MTNKYVGVGLVAILIIAIIGVFTPQGENVVERVIEKTVGSVAGPDVYGEFRVHGAFEQGGCKTTMSQLESTYTITANDMRVCNILTFTASSTQAALTATLPASTTFPLSAEVGASRTWIIENPFTASATTTTIAAGTGINMQEPDGQNVVIAQDNYAWLTCIRGADTGKPEDIVCKVDETIPG